MFRSSLPLLFFLLLGSVSAGLLFVRNPDGTFTEKVDNGSGTLRGRDEPDKCSCIETLPADFAPPSSLDGRSQSSRTDKTEENCTCIESLPADFIPGTKNAHATAEDPLDDEDDELVHGYSPDHKINQNGNLRYSDLPLVEKSLKKDIFMLIAKNEDYMSFLNNPSHKDLFVMINDMIRGPSQEVLQDQIWNKILAIEAFYKKFVEPLNRPDSIEKVMKLLMRLEGASGAGELTVEDTVQLDENLEKLAFLFNQNLTQRLLTMIENNLHPVSLEHKRSHHVRKSAVSETSTGVPSSNQTDNFVNVPPSSFGRMENITFSKVNSSENHVEKDVVTVTNDRKSSDDARVGPRNFSFGDDVKKFLSGSSKEDSSLSAGKDSEMAEGKHPGQKTTSSSKTHLREVDTIVPPVKKNAASAVDDHPSILTETEMTEGNHPGQKTTSSSKTHLREFDTIVPPVRRTRGNSFS
ncbi:hypothetical protein CAEBREN_17361 [Caenorhabditis brenneri]|uniref:Uncharacterized protein n=1 Tax=Caenorhabditis brenneri TaxID=135651 RepID=G0MYK2_CAEBE|nr:hypothetical protein CAEBREN_17361 [Caenorhabditis brenneri]